MSIDDGTTPFRFEDLNGAPEPERWGEAYPKTASAAVTKWRTIGAGRALTAEESAEYGRAVHEWTRSRNAPKKTPSTLPTASNCASGQSLDYDRKKYRAALLARLAAQAAKDKAAWSYGEAESYLVGHSGLTIHKAYALAMAGKRAREAAAELAA